MKKVIVLITACIFSLNTMAQISSATAKSNIIWKNKYCATMKNGKLTMMSEGKEMTADVSLTNGVKVSTSGIVTRANGTTVTLKNGECLDKDGNVVKEKEKMPAK